MSLRDWEENRKAYDAAVAEAGRAARAQGSTTMEEDKIASENRVEPDLSGAAFLKRVADAMDEVAIIKGKPEEKAWRPEGLDILVKSQQKAGGAGPSSTEQTKEADGDAVKGAKVN